MRTIFLFGFAACMGFAQMAPGGGGAGAATRAALPAPSEVQTGGVNLQQTVVGSGVTSVNGSVAVSGNLAGSVPDQASQPGAVSLSLADAVSRGLRHNLGTIEADLSVRDSRASRLQYLSSLLPNIWANASETLTQVNLAAYGFQFKLPPGLNFSIPSVVGPFSYSSLTGNLSQSIWDPVARLNYKQAKLSERSAQLSAQDMRELVVVAVAGTYLQILAEQERADSQRADVATAEAVYNQAVVRKSAGTNAKIDVARSYVEWQSEQQRLIALQADLDKQKLVLARVIGLRMDQAVVLTSALAPNGPGAAPTIDDLLNSAFQNRFDLRAADTAVKAAAVAVSAARAERLPSLAVNGDYGVLGPNPATTHGVFAVTGSVNVPIWNGGRVSGDVSEAETVLERRRAEYADLKAHVEQDLRQARIDWESAAKQLSVAQTNRDYAQEVLREARDRFEAGVANTVEVVQAQEQVSGAEESYVSSLFAYQLAQLSMARATGTAEKSVQTLLSGGHQ